MSSSVSSIEHTDYEIDEPREGQTESVPQSPGGVGNSPHEPGLRSKLKRFWNKTRIPAVVKKVVAGSKSLLSRLTPRFTPNATTSESMQRCETNAAPRVERVKFPEDVTPSPASSSNAASPYVSTGAANVDIHLTASAPTAAAVLTPAPIPPVNDSIISERAMRSETANDLSLSDFRYKEKLGKQKSFLEIKLGVVSSRVRWLEPLMSGEKAGRRNSRPDEDGNLQVSTGRETEDAPQALEIHEPSGLAPRMNEGKAEGVLKTGESDDESVFDDSPRLYKHRLPEEEPKPWVEPGTVAKGARWLQPVMSGEKQTSSGDSDPGNLTFPKGIVRVAFCGRSGDNCKGRNPSKIVGRVRM